MKFAVETFYTAKMTVFAQCCGYSLALSHARSGDAAMICGCLGRCDEVRQTSAPASPGSKAAFMSQQALGLHVILPPDRKIDVMLSWLRSCGASFKLMRPPKT